MFKFLKRKKVQKQANDDLLEIIESNNKALEDMLHTVQRENAALQKSIDILEPLVSMGDDVDEDELNAVLRRVVASLHIDDESHKMGTVIDITGRVAQ